MHSEEKVFNPKHMSKLEHPDRYKEVPPEKILNELGLKDGHKFGDFGCGIGFFSIPASDRVGSKGRVYASDISPDMLDGLKERIPTENNNNIEFCLAGSEASVNGTGIGNDILDRAMISMVLHEVDSPEAFLNMAGKSIKPGGKLAIVEWIKKEMPHGPKLEIRISEEEMNVLLNKSGFTTEKYIQLSERFYLTIATK